ncbi:unnamed protein product [Vitrella brassicaformis CCMP3155]|uniref:Uncharacterized protein n=1 Tax=Vitrella brassicaformis (strain CCMP3155) TaxID=1169540 RepID=A0A0G4FBH8_VITBC|nr:unnamed protein product [Vitrella brassicaformis CCMP3155]|eukprot:CEM09982.1 unnamed protein product [Vitrella brassicaformis CCMP3155]
MEVEAAPSPGEAGPPEFADLEDAGPLLLVSRFLTARELLHAFYLVSRRMQRAATDAQLWTAVDTGALGLTIRQQKVLLNRLDDACYRQMRRLVLAGHEGVEHVAAGVRDVLQTCQLQRFSCPGLLDSDQGPLLLSYLSQLPNLHTLEVARHPEWVDNTPPVPMAPAPAPMALVMRRYTQCVWPADDGLFQQLVYVNISGLALPMTDNRDRSRLMELLLRLPRLEEINARPPHSRPEELYLARRCNMRAVTRQMSRALLDQFAAIKEAERRDGAAARRHVRVNMFNDGRLPRRIVILCTQCKRVLFHCEGTYAIARGSQPHIDIELYVFGDTVIRTNVVGGLFNQKYAKSCASKCHERHHLYLLADEESPIETHGFTYGVACGPSLAIFASTNDHHPSPPASATTSISTITASAHQHQQQQQPEVPAIRLERSAASLIGPRGLYVSDDELRSGRDEFAAFLQVAGSASAVRRYDAAAPLAPGLLWALQAVQLLGGGGDGGGGGGGDDGAHVQNLNDLVGGDMFDDDDEDDLDDIDEDEWPFMLDDDEDDGHHFEEEENG